MSKWKVTTCCMEHVVLLVADDNGNEQATMQLTNVQAAELAEALYNNATNNTVLKHLIASQSRADSGFTPMLPESSHKH